MAGTVAAGTVTVTASIDAAIVTAFWNLTRADQRFVIAAYHSNGGMHGHG